MLPNSLCSHMRDSLQRTSPKIEPVALTALLLQRWHTQKAILPPSTLFNDTSPSPHAKDNPKKVVPSHTSQAVRKLSFLICWTDRALGTLVLDNWQDSNSLSSGSAAGLSGLPVEVGGVRLGSSRDLEGHAFSFNSYTCIQGSPSFLRCAGEAAVGGTSLFSVPERGREGGQQDHGRLLQGEGDFRYRPLRRALTSVESS